MSREPRNSVRIGVAGLYVAALTYLLLAPVPLWFLGSGAEETQAAINSRFSDLAQHFVAYAILAALLVWATSRRSTSQIRWSFGLAAGHGVLGECLQPFVPERFFGWPDLAADMLGVTCGTAAAIAVLVAVRCRIRCG